jgi:catechol 2,3-dioxygenase-like lactoylglutathione lyase family enzyme
MTITHLRSLAIATPWFDESMAYYTTHIGLTVVRSGSDHGVLTGKGDEPKLLEIHRGDAVGLRGVALGAASRADVDATATALKTKGVTIIQPPAEDEDGYGLRLRDPDGNEIAIIAGPGTGSASPEHADGHPFALSHVVINSDHPQRLTAFFTDMLGFRIADAYEQDLLTFLRCDQPQHHCIGIGKADKPGLNHFSFECGSLDGVMKAVGRMKRGGHEPIWGPGRHGPGGNVFAYYADPSKLVPEFTTEVIQITDEVAWEARTWPRTPESANVWGTGGPTETAIALMSGRI